MVQALIAFMALDFVLGFAASVKNHTTGQPGDVLGRGK